MFFSFICGVVDFKQRKQPGFSQAAFFYF